MWHWWHHVTFTLSCRRCIHRASKVEYAVKIVEKVRGEGWWRGARTPGVNGVKVGREVPVG